MLTRIDQQTAPEKCLYYPMIALVVQGKKQAFYGEQEMIYGAGEYVVLGSVMAGIFILRGLRRLRPFFHVDAAMGKLKEFYGKNL